MLLVKSIFLLLIFGMLSVLVAISSILLNQHAGRAFIDPLTLAVAAPLAVLGLLCLILSGAALRRAVQRVYSADL